MKFFRSRAGLLFLLFFCLAARADLPGAGFCPARVFSDNMVLQRDVAVPRWEVRLPNTATVNTDDCDTIHPRKKRPVGERLAEKAMSLNPTLTTK